MKMNKKSYNYIVTLFEDNKQIIEESAKQLKESGKYNDFYTRLGWSALRYTTKKDNYPTFITDILYNVQGLNDNHITTGVRKALKEIGITE